jgi:hypothetical protein
MAVRGGYFKAPGRALDRPHPICNLGWPLRHRSAMTPEEIVRQLPDTLEYSGEFGPEIVCFVPFVHWLHQAGRLGRRRVLTYPGMRPFYFFLADANYAEKSEARRYVPAREMPAYLPNPSEQRGRKTAFEVFPDYRGAFGGRFARNCKKPILVVHNKHCLEWGIGPINFMAVDSLDRLFDALKQEFQIVYFREGFGSVDLALLGYSADHNTPLPFDDAAVLERHPEVLSFERLAAASPDRHAYNRLKLEVFADCRRFIVSQGGGAHLAAWFADTLVVLHRMGYELRNAYVNGFYRYAIEPPLRLLITRNTAQLEEAAGIFRMGAAAPEAGQLLERFRPEHCFEPDHVPARPTVW